MLNQTTFSRFEDWNHAKATVVAAARGLLEGTVTPEELAALLKAEAEARAAFQSSLTDS